MVFSLDVEGRQNFSDREHQKEKKELDLLAKKYIVSLDIVNKFVLERGMDRPLDELKYLAEHVDNISEATKFIRKNSNLDKYHLHDVNNMGAGFLGFLGLFMEALKKGTFDYDDEENFVKQSLEEYRSDWFRFYVAMKDVLLRQLFVPEAEYEVVDDFNLEVVRNVLDFFVKKEIEKLKTRKTQDIFYEGIENRKLKINVDWDDLSKQLKGKKIKGDVAVILDAVLNKVRNSLKKNIEVAGQNTEIDVDIFVEGNELVIRVSDTGKGMEFRHLDPKDADCIFKKGSSSTGSSGLGLADLHIRLAQMGVEIVILSKRVGQEKFEYYSNGSDMPGKTLTFHDHDEVEKMFDKDSERDFAKKVKEKGHGTVISLYIPLAA